MKQTYLDNFNKIATRFKAYYNTGIPAVECELNLLNDQRLSKIDNNLFTYLYNNAVKGIVTNMIFEVYDTWNCINDSHSKLNFNFSKDEVAEYKKLHALRNKLFAHKFQSFLSDPNIYATNLADFPTQLDRFNLAIKVASIINNKINELVKNDKIQLSEELNQISFYQRIENYDIDSFIRRMSTVFKGD